MGHDWAMRAQDGPPLPRRVCILRLSALGDCANVVPVVHTLQAARPDIEITWIINRGESALVADLPGVTVLPIDKRAGRRGLRDLKTRLAGQRFDALLHMHASWRANRISRRLRAARRIGFDARRARDGQRLFVNERIAPPAGRHVVDGFLAFAAHLGAHTPVYDWRVPVGQAARQRVAALLGDDSRQVLLICPCSSHVRRSWQAGRYAAVADYAARVHGLRCVLAGGPSAAERALGDEIAAAAIEPVANLIGQTHLQELLALFERARLIVSADSGPAHMANAANTPTISLHAATDSRRSGSYRWRDLCMDYYAAAAKKYRRATPDTLKWGTRIEDDARVMALIPVEAVTRRIDQAMAKHDDSSKDIYPQMSQMDTDIRRG